MLDLSITDAVACVTLSRAPMNPIDDSWIGEFNRMLDAVETDEHCRVLHVRSTAKGFCAGFDLKLAAERLGTAEGVAAMGRSTQNLRDLYARIEASQLITFAEIGGAAVGGGLELALACDLRAASNTAKLGLPELNLGLLPAAGGTQRLTRLCGRATAMRLILSGDLIAGEAGAALGLVQWSLPGDQLPTFAVETCARLAKQPKKAVHWAKTCIAAAEEPGDDGYRAEQRGSETLAADDVTKRVVESFFKGLG